MAAEQSAGDRVSVILASGSPRRRAFLDDLGLVFRVVPADIDETPLISESPAEYVARLASTKASAVGSSGGESGGTVVVIAADTTVVLDGEIIGKPVNPDDARSILRRLSGRTHEVLTGVAVSGGAQIFSAQTISARTVSRVVTTSVQFAELSDADIDWYVGTGEPLDKAGAYGIQARGGSFVRSIDGSLSNVIGLPLVELGEMLDELGFPLSRLRAS